MSTSVVLEGSICNLSSPDNATWNGTWRFAKDKKGVLEFSYKKLSNEVPFDLYEYVSFLDASSLNGPGSRSGSHVNKSKKRGRGRPRSNSYGASSLDGSINPSNEKSESIGDFESGYKETLEEITDASSGISNSKQSNEDLEDQHEEKLDTNLASITQISNADISELHDETFTSEDLDEHNSKPIKIVEEHPLMGLWEGSFKVKNIKGTEDTVPETLFFYSTLGSDPPAEFKDLPPEPSFPFCLIKGAQWASFLNSQSVKKEIQTNTTPVEPIPLEEISSQQNIGSNELSFNEEKTIMGADGNVDSSSATIVSQIKVEEDSKDTGSVPQILEPNQQIEDKGSLSNPTFAAAFDQICNRVLIGFGRNAIGRFSVAAVYDENTGELRCEKKYMTVKHSIKRGRRSYAEYAMAYSNGLQAGSNDKMPPPAPVGIKPQRRYSIDSVSDVNSHPSRQRTKNSLYFSYDDETTADDVNSGVSSKKRRMSSGSLSTTTALAPTSVKKENSLSGYRDKSSHKNHPTVLTEENIHEFLKSHKNLLIGPRNPDNDILLAQSSYAMANSNSKGGKLISPSGDTNAITSGFTTSNLAGAIYDVSTGILYRDAFFDCESGEIYEGEWFNGNRNGRGIVVYADGLMYEGTWLKGKEHGKGDLMLMDRTVLYSGDWYEGYFHGHGTYRYPNGDVYTGDWKEGIRHGRGEYVYGSFQAQNSSSSSSSGAAANSSEDISLLSKSQPRYIGDWRDNKRHGKGRFIWPDGSVYDGDWENDLRHGRGLLELSNGFNYEGSWYRNVMEGKGSCIFPSGQCYQGTFKSGLRDGRGSITFAEGAVYEGRFREDRFDGQGTLKINQVVPGIEDDELFIPIQMQSDLWRIHWKAGFGSTHH